VCTYVYLYIYAYFLIILNLVQRKVINLIFYYFFPILNIKRYWLK